jgi:hypothetical protein
MDHGQGNGQINFLVMFIISVGVLWLFMVVINHLLLLFHLVREIFRANQPGHLHMDSLANFLGGMLAAVLVAKLVYYLANFPRFKREISGKIME